MTAPSSSIVWPLPHFTNAAPVEGMPFVDVMRKAGLTAVNLVLASEPNYTPDLRTALYRINDNLAMLASYADRMIHV